jgi:hypothetical protein
MPYYDITRCRSKGWDVETASFSTAGVDEAGKELVLVPIPRRPRRLQGLYFPYQVQI